MTQPVSDGKRKVFSEEERLLLCSLVTAHEGLLKAQSAHGTSTKERRRQWEKIAASFNNRPTVTNRTAPELRKAWENMKYRAKHALDRQYRMVRDSVGDSSSPVDLEGEIPVALLPSQCLETIMLHENQEHLVKTEPCDGEYDNHGGIPDPTVSVTTTAEVSLTVPTATPVTPPTRTTSPTSSTGLENGHIRVKKGRGCKMLCDHDIVLAKKQRELVDLQLEVYNLKKLVALNKLQHMQKAYEVDLRHREEEHKLKMCLLKRAVEK